MAGHGAASAPVAACGVLGLLEASGSYNFDYIAWDGPPGWTPPFETICGSNIRSVDLGRLVGSRMKLDQCTAGSRTAKRAEGAQVVYGMCATFRFQQPQNHSALFAP